jgi:hypothetical protein
MKTGDLISFRELKHKLLRVVVVWQHFLELQVNKSLITASERRLRGSFRRLGSWGRSVGFGIRSQKSVATVASYCCCSTDDPWR